AQRGAREEVGVPVSKRAMKPAVLVTMQLPPAAMSRLEQHAAVTTVLDQSDPRFAAARAGAEGMLINPRTRIDRELFARAPKLRAVSTYSVGLDHIDLAAAEQRGGCGPCGQLAPRA
ncbi:MAG TPA: hypothetical protein VGY99_02420, partial [Candidatus Binataceae bacterium]|nr:hypothetical protein [Candidatus Binataceae bacterium]